MCAFCWGMVQGSCRWGSQCETLPGNCPFCCSRMPWEWELCWGPIAGCSPLCTASGLDSPQGAPAPGGGGRPRAGTTGYQIRSESTELMLVPFFLSWGSCGESLPASPLPAALTLSPSAPHPTRPGQLCFCKGIDLDITAPHLSPPCVQGLPSGRLPKWRI